MLLWQAVCRRVLLFQVIPKRIMSQMRRSQINLCF